MTVRRRTAARVVLLDDQDRLLLFHGFDPDEPDRTWWITPGGGLEAGEGQREAALRELAEETGLTAVELGPVVAFERAEFSFGGRQYVQEQWFHLARTRQTALDSSGSTAKEQEQLREARWWTVAELRATTETVYPKGLAEFVERLLSQGPPVAPVRL